MPGLQLIKDGSARDKDPSLTQTLRNTLSSKFSGKFRKISAEARKKIVTNNFFEAENNVSANVSEKFVSNQYSYPSSPQKISEFMTWLQQMIDANIFERVYAGTPFQEGIYPLWANTYILSAYKRGLQQSRGDLDRMGFGSFLPQAVVAEQVFLNMPVHIDALNTLYIRMYESLKGITAEMSGQISAVLTQGIAEGKGPIELARQIANRIDKIGITRAKRLARTEIVRAHNIASLNNYKYLDAMIDEELQVQYWTAADERVRSKHRERHGKVMAIEDGYSLIGEPNCRCVLIPYIESINGDESLNLPDPEWRERQPAYEQ